MICPICNNKFYKLKFVLLTRFNSMKCPHCGIKLTIVYTLSSFLFSMIALAAIVLFIESLSIWYIIPYLVIRAIFDFFTIKFNTIKDN